MQAICINSFGIYIIYFVMGYQEISALERLSTRLTILRCFGTCWFLASSKGHWHFI